jgi:hypothetical protein
MIHFGNVFCCWPDCFWRVGGAFPQHRLDVFDLVDLPLLQRALALLFKFAMGFTCAPSPTASRGEAVL